MGYIKKLKNNELVGGTDKTTIYPVTSTEAVFEEVSENNFQSQKAINVDRLERIETLEAHDENHEGRVSTLEEHDSDHESRVQELEDTMPDTVKSITINGSTKTYTVDDKGNVDLTVYTVDSDPEMPSIADNVRDLRDVVGTSEEVLPGSHKTRIETLEGGESVTGSVENKIKTKVDSINSSYQDDNNEYVKYSMTQTSGKVTNFNIDETSLKNAITSLNTSISGDNIVIRQGSTPSGTGEAGKIYRYVNSSNNTYTDYMYSGGSWVPLATHDTSNEQAQVAYYTCTATGSGAQATKQFVGNGSLTYTPSSGGHIKILMGEANTATGTIYLQFGTTTSTKKPLYYNGESVSSDNTWEAGETIAVYYDPSANNNTGAYFASNAQGGGGKAEKIKYDNAQSGLAAENVQGALDETAGGLAGLGERCIEEGERVTSSVLAQQGKWDASGQIRTEAKNRAHLLVECIGYDKLILEIPQGFFATLYYVNSSYESIVQIGSGWFSGTNSFVLNRNYNIMLNIKDENESVLTTAALAGHYWGITLIEANGYKPAAAYDDLQVYTQDLSSRKMITKEEFVQGTNNTNGVPINNGNAAPYRCITYNLIDVDSNTTISVVNNGQYHLMLTYSSAGVYEGTTGWVSTDAIYTFNSSKKVRFLASWNGGLTTTISPSQVALSIILFEKFDRLTNTEEDIESINNKIKVLGGDVELTQSDFIQGSNIANGNININNTKRCITLYQYDVDANTVITVNNNGQAHVMLTYDEDGVYESTTGWVKENEVFEYTFDTKKKVRFLVSWDGSITNDITPSDILATFNIHHKSDVESIEEEIGGSATTKANDSFCRFNKKISVYNPYKDHPQNQYKGQMHCHTTNSDGNLSPANVVAKYVGYGYDFMTITDHNYITPNPSPNADIVWMGNSYEDTWNAAGHQHMNVWNCSEVINKVNQYTTSNTPLILVNHYVKNGNSVLSYNHPEYPVVYASDVTLGGLPSGISFVEIYNSTIQTYLGEVDSLPAVANFGDMVTYNNGTRYINTSITKASPNWQATTEEANPDGNLDRGFRIMLDNGHKVFCDAVDDFHRGDNMENRGWQMVFANSRTKQSIWNGLLMGASYASTGVSLNDVSFVDGVFRLDIADGASAVTTFYGYNNEVLGTSNGSIAIYEMTGDEKYVRAMVVIDGKKAWTQPIWIIAVGEQYEF